jgi:hypothetical protein
MKGGRLLAAAGMAAAAYALYHATLLHGFDLGDTGFFQTAVGSKTLTPRDGYPLYFAIGNLFLRVTGANPARALNLASAVEGAAAAGLMVLVAAELSGSVGAALGASLLFAGSYTFWSQAIIAEVYALHMAFVMLTLLLLLRWARGPTTGRLAIFLAAYAIGFGNHLSMVLLFPGYCYFVVFARPGRWREAFAVRVIGLALGIAAAGSLQYLWNLRGLWQWPDAPRGVADALATFWFDVTKADWRETMILNVPRSILVDRLAMYAFELRQQFGWAVLLAPLGLIHLFATNARRGVLMLLLYLVNAAFAYTYNVGDTHVFYLPSHAILALLAAPGTVLAAQFAARLAAGVASRVAARRDTRAPALLAAAPSIRARLASVTVASMLLVAAAAWRAHWNLPALDRTDDDRPAQVLGSLTRGLDDQRAILLADLNWQLVNGLAYFAKIIRPDLAYAWISRVLLYAPALIRDNLAMGRDVMLTERAHAALSHAFGPLVPTTLDRRRQVPAMAEIARDLAPGTRYVLAVLRPTREFAIDRTDLARAVQILTSRSIPMPEGAYAVLAGLSGQPPTLSWGSSRPFRQTVRVGAVAVEVRMESWLAFDTIRRMGFGQVVAARRHTLIIERGVSFAAFDGEGRPTTIAYAANIFAPQARYVVARSP